MKQNPGRPTCLLLLISGGIALLFIAGLAYYFYVVSKALEGKRALSGPPTILVRAPQAGDTVAPDSFMLAQAVVSAKNPIARVEVWLDGKVVDTQISDAQNQTTVYAHFELKLSAGTHILFWRAVDNAGLVGQSAPIPIAGEFPSGAGETTTVNANEGQSVEDIADAQGIDPGVLQDLNPNLGAGGLPGGTPVNVPAVPAGPRFGFTGDAKISNNAPTPPLPNAPPGIAALAPVTQPTLDLAPLMPGLLNNFPSAPSYLQAGFENCTIRLVWNDNATKETGFNIWMQALGGPPLKIEMLKSRPNTGQAWFEFASPSFGIYSFWVEAVNALGAQASEIAWVAVNDTSCGEGVASQLEIEALGMYGFEGGWERIYCYLAIEGAPEARIPQDDSQFLQKDFLGGADIHKWIGGKNRILIKMPMDEEVSLEGDCWGWLGDRPASMGVFGVSVPKEHWDNRTLQARAASYVIDFRIRPFGATDVEGAFAYLDYGISAPYDLSVDAIQPENDPRVNAMHMQSPTVRWKWDGDAADVTGFTVYVDGSIAAWVSDTFGRQATLLLPTTCGGTYEIRATAHSGQAQSKLSDAVEFKQPPCEQYAEVYFEYFNFSYIDDGEIGDCDSPEPYIWVDVNNLSREYKYMEGDLSCGVDYQLSDFLGGESRAIPYDPDLFVVPIDPANPFLHISAIFWDHDDFCYLVYCGPLDSDVLCAYEKNISFSPMSIEEWTNYNESIWEACTSSEDFGMDEIDGSGVIKYRVRGLNGPQ